MRRLPDLPWMPGRERLRERRAEPRSRCCAGRACRPGTPARRPASRTSSGSRPPAPSGHVRSTRVTPRTPIPAAARAHGPRSSRAERGARRPPGAVPACGSSGPGCPVPPRRRPEPEAARAAGRRRPHAARAPGARSAARPGTPRAPTPSRARSRRGIPRRARMQRPRWSTSDPGHPAHYLAMLVLAVSEPGRSALPPEDPAASLAGGHDPPADRGVPPAAARTLGWTGPAGCNIGRVSERYRRFTLAPGGARRSRLRLTPPGASRTTDSPVSLWGVLAPGSRAAARPGGRRAR